MPVPPSSANDQSKNGIGQKVISSIVYQKILNIREMRKGMVFLTLCQSGMSDENFIMFKLISQTIVM